MRKTRKRALIGAGLGLGLAANTYLYLKRSKLRSLDRQVVLITGGSRGLGLALAHEFAHQGARVIICARNLEALTLAETQLKVAGADVLAIQCDVSDQEQVEQLIKQSITQCGAIDILVNNAGIITVGPQQAMALEDYENCMNTMFWGTVYTTLAVLPHMRRLQSGQIVNIASIGGRVSVPHLLPYSCAKFAALGFSEGLHAELAQEGIKVTSVIPGLMRTGSHRNALFKGQREQEYALFGLMATSPLTAISAARAARQIVRATRRGATELTITPQAQLMSSLHGLLPGTTTALFGLTTRFLPTADESTQKQEALPGYKSNSALAEQLTRWGQEAVRIYNQLAPQESEELRASESRL